VAGPQGGSARSSARPRRRSAPVQQHRHFPADGQSWCLAPLAASARAARRADAFDIRSKATCESPSTARTGRSRARTASGHVHKRLQRLGERCADPLEIGGISSVVDPKGIRSATRGRERPSAGAAGYPATRSATTARRSRSTGSSGFGPRDARETASTSAPIPARQEVIDVRRQRLRARPTATYKRAAGAPRVRCSRRPAVGKDGGVRLHGDDHRRNRDAAISFTPTTFPDTMVNGGAWTTGKYASWKHR